MSGHSPAALALIRLMEAMPRGPRREGLFALWLVLRVAEDLLLTPPPPDRGMRRRVAALEHRLSSLSFPATLRRAMVSALAELKEPGRDRVVPLLLLLVAPVREALGPEAGEIVARAARSPAHRAREEP